MLRHEGLKQIRVVCFYVVIIADQMHIYPIAGKFRASRSNSRQDAGKNIA